jgi:hypothetical protein
MPSRHSLLLLLLLLLAQGQYACTHAAAAECASDHFKQVLASICCHQVLQEQRGRARSSCSKQLTAHELC